jgi:hypothetical protein
MDKKYYDAVLYTPNSSNYYGNDKLAILYNKALSNSFDLLSYPITITKQTCLRFSQYLGIDVIMAV